ncbi:unnamed protein product [Leptidea sinapis]|uniref:Uncharacterized protein n=1 Tax=Leptidea sinapis TaxID=189913 RepID=A0A5E4PQL7_9NEOP|nr:unnamed protein product [Leptidea sinapis]
MQCYPKLSPKREPMDHGYDLEMIGSRRLDLPAAPGKEFRAPCVPPAPVTQQPQSVIQCMRPPPPPPPPPRIIKPSLFEEPTSSIPDLASASLPQETDHLSDLELGESTVRFQ